MKHHKEKLGMRKLVILTTLFLIGVAGASAQTATITDADSNLSDTQITAEFTGLPTDTQLEVQSLGDDTTTVKTFTTSSAGTATVTWRHNPFQDGTALISDGWTYAVRSSDGSTNFEFEAAHGNMLLGLDAFNDNNYNSSMYDMYISAGDSCDGSDIREDSKNLIIESKVFSSGQDCVVSNIWTDEVDHNEAYKATLSVPDDAGFNGDAGWSAYMLPPTSGDSPSDSIAVYDGTEKNVKKNIVMYISESGTATIEVDGNIVEESTINSDSFRPAISVDNRGGNARGPLITEVYNHSITPRVGRNAWDEPNRFNPESISTLQFSNFLVNQDGTSGIEFSNDSQSWSVTPPTNGEQLYYRTTGSGTLGAVAVDTSQLLGGLDFIPNIPENNTAFVVPQNETHQQDFSWEYVYERDDCSESVAAVADWELYDRDTGERVEQTIFTSPFLPEGQCQYYQVFTESATVPPGNYRWETSFYEGNLDVNRENNMHFSVVAEESPIDFNQSSPSEGETVELQNGATTFDYSVESENAGTLQLLLYPELEGNVQYSTTIDAGNYSTSVNVGNLSSDYSYEWQLRFIDNSTDTSYVSDRVPFSTTGEGADPGNGDNGGGGDGGNGDGSEAKYDVEQMYFNFMEDFFGISETSAGYIAGLMISLTIALAAAVIAGFADMRGTVFPAIGFLTGFLYSTIIGLFPGWVAFVLAVLSAALIAKTGVGILNE